MSRIKHNGWVFVPHTPFGARGRRSKRAAFAAHARKLRAWVREMRSPRQEQPQPVAGRIGSLYENALVLKVPEGPWYYLLLMDNHDLQWEIYCQEATIVPADAGEAAEVRCLDKTFRAPCWPIDRHSYVSESMRITDAINARAEA